MNFETLLDLAIERIRPHLPEDYEIDDVAWGENAFQICIFDVSKFPVKFADCFLFTRYPGETESDTVDRFNEAVTEFTTNWRK